MNYIEVEFAIKNEEYVSDLLSAALGEIGFESFVPSENGLKAYIQSDLFSETNIQNLITNFNIYSSISNYKITKIKSENWNEEWEKNYFKPIIIGNECVIHSSFHVNIPETRYRIIIDPKMSFGTGHHETTGLVIEQLLQADLSGKTILDMGCGTAVLAILARMRGAKHALAIDIDDWCTQNSEENIALNNISDIDVMLGGAELLENKHFDIILANINRNILLNDMKHYANCLSTGGELYMSGFYVEDIPVIEAEANKHNLSLIDFKEKNKWAVVKFCKQ
jgi:Ribosomal protein L11 methylase